MPKITKRKLFNKYNHSELGLVRTIEEIDGHPVTLEAGIWFKVEVVGSNPIERHYVLNNSLKYV